MGGLGFAYGLKGWSWNDGFDDPAISDRVKEGKKVFRDLKGVVRREESRIGGKVVKWTIDRVLSI